MADAPATSLILTTRQRQLLDALDDGGRRYFTVAELQALVGAPTVEPVLRVLGQLRARGLVTPSVYAAATPDAYSWAMTTLGEAELRIADQLRLV